MSAVEDSTRLGLAYFPLVGNGRLVDGLSGDGSWSRFWVPILFEQAFAVAHATDSTVRSATDATRRAATHAAGATARFNAARTWIVTIATQTAEKIS